MSDEGQTYEEKLARLEEILRRLDDSETPIDALAEDVKLGARLIRELDSKLRKIESEVVDALDELERGDTPEAPEPANS